MMGSRMEMLIDPIVVNRDLRLVIAEAPFTGRYDLKVDNDNMYIILKDYFETVWATRIKSFEDLRHIFEMCEFEVEEVEDGWIKVILEDRFKAITDKIKRLVVSAQDHERTLVEINDLIVSWYNKLDNQERIRFVEGCGGLLEDINELRKLSEAIKHNSRKD